MHGVICCVKAEAYKMAIDDGYDDQNLYCSCLEYNKCFKSEVSMLAYDCETLQFSHPIFQETIYGLWTEQQCIQLHEKAALFLESQAHKCKSYGRGGFIAGGQNTQYLKKMSGDSGGGNGKGKMSGKIRAFVCLHRRKARERRCKVFPSKEVNDFSTPSSYKGHQYQSAFIKGTHGRHFIPSLHCNWVSNAQFSTISRNGMGSTRQNSSQSNQWNPIISCITEDVDLQNCQCTEVLAEVYSQLIKHWKAVDNKQKIVHCLIEAANAAITTNNDMEALALLDEAKEIMQKSKVKILSEHEMAVFESSYGQVSY